MNKKAKRTQNEAPISEAMEAYAGDGALAFHTPGHKQGLGAHPLLKKLITEEGLRQEVSLMEELDDLHAPSGCIKEAETLAAELWGAKETLFMINGTTGAIHAMLLGTLKHGDKVIVPRNAHRSIIGGIILAGAKPVFIQPEIHHQLGITLGLSPKKVKKVLQANPDAKAMVVVYPTYYGVATDLRVLAEMLHVRNMLLLVDEAHGAHLRFSQGLPPQALECGADVVCQSTHKLLGSMTQTSMLHIGSDRVSSERIREAAALLQSTSPNQLLLASLDIARLQMAESGFMLAARAVNLANWVRSKINKIPGLYCVGDEILGTPWAYKLDPTKITVNLEGIDLPGPEAETMLRFMFGVQCELSDPRNILFIISIADTEQECIKLVEALQNLSDMRYDENREINEEFSEPVPVLPIPKMSANPRRSFFANKVKMDFDKAGGLVSGETVIFYPPGVPVLCPGEYITPEIIEYIRDRQAKGARIVGPADTELKTIKILR